MASECFVMVKEKYASGKWTRKMLRALAANGRITEAEYEEITEEVYGT